MQHPLAYLATSHGTHYVTRLAFAFVMALGGIGPDPDVARPTIQQIHVAADTVWFVASAPDAEEASYAYCYVRTQRRWCRTSLPKRLPDRPVPLDRRLYERAPAQRLTMGAGWQYGCLVVSDGCTAAFIRGTKVVRLTPRGTAATTPRRPFSDRFASLAARRGALWLGLAGSYAEGTDERGGLVALDSATGSARWLTHASLDEMTINAMVSDSAGLWLATSQPAEYGDGDGGLVRYEPEKPLAARFSMISAKSGAIPDDIVLDLGAGGGLLAVVTKYGLAVRESDGRWDRRFYRLKAVGDSIVTDLDVSGPDRLEDARVAKLLAVQRLRLPNMGAVATALEGVSVPQNLADLTFASDDFAKVLSHPTIAPLMLNAARLAPDSVDPLVFTAIGLSRATTAVPFLRTQLLRVSAETAADPSRSAEIAVALARLGDQRGQQWIEANVERQTNAPGLRAAAVHAVRGGSVTAQRRITTLMATTRVLPADLGGESVYADGSMDVTLATNLFQTLFSARPDVPWSAIDLALTRNPALRYAFIVSADSAEDASPVGRQLLIRETLAAFRETDSTTALAVRFAPFRARDPRVIGALMEMIERGVPGVLYASAIRSLVGLTGLANAPYIAPIPDRVTAPRAGRFWVDWRATQRGTLPLASLEAGRRAMREWTDVGERRLPMPTGSPTQRRARPRS